MNTETQREKLFLLMVQHNLTQVALAQMQGVTDCAVRRWLQSEDQPGH